MEHPTIILGSQSCGLTLTIWRRAHADAHDYWDGNWLSTRVHIIIGGFHGTVDADLRAEEFDEFREQLRRLYKSLSGRAEFYSIEGWVALLLEGDGLGHIKCKGTILDQPGIGNRLDFTLDLDQSYLPKLIDDLDHLLSIFPVIGHT